MMKYLILIVGLVFTAQVYGVEKCNANHKRLTNLRDVNTCFLIQEWQGQVTDEIRKATDKYDNLHLNFDGEIGDEIYKEVSHIKNVYQEGVTIRSTHLIKLQKLFKKLECNKRLNEKI